MTTQTLVGRRPTSVSPFVILNLDEDLEVGVALFDSPGQLIASARELRRWRSASQAVVVCLPEQLHRRELAAALDVLILASDRVVVTGGPTTPPDAVTDAARGQWPTLVQYEPDPGRAVVGTMMSLREGDSLALLWPAELGHNTAEDHVTQGSRWRAAWEAPEDGVFHRLPG